MEDKNLRLKLNVLFFTVYGALGFYSPFLIIFFKNRNLNFTQIGILFAVLSLASVICQPIWGYITDKYLSAKITLSIGNLLSSILIAVITSAHSFEYIFILVISISFFQNSIYPILDAFCMEIASKYEIIEFEKTKIRGSFGYAVGVASAGVIIKYFGIAFSFYIFGLLSIISILIISTIKYESKNKKQDLNVADIAGLLKEKRFAVFILSVLILNITFGANGNYIGELIKQTGGDVSNLGFLWFIVAISEIPIYFIGKRILNKFDDLKLYFISVIFFAVRFYADSICTNWISVSAVQLLQSITFALYVISTLHYINRIVDTNMRMSGITIYSAIGGGLGGFIGNLFGGIALGSISIFSLYKILAFISIISLLVGQFIQKAAYRNQEHPLDIP